MPYAPPTSCEIERLFSTIKAKELNSRNFTCENLKNLFFFEIEMINYFDLI